MKSWQILNGYFVTTFLNNDLKEELQDLGQPSFSLEVLAGGTSSQIWPGLYNKEESSLI